MTTVPDDVKILLKKVSEDAAEEVLYILLQPFMDVHHTHCVGAEALVRGRVSGKTLFPDQFIDLMEKNGDICKVGIFVLERGLQYALDNNLHLRPTFYMSFNFSPVELNNAALATEICAIITRLNYPVGKIIIEVTETTVDLTRQGLANVDRLQRQGIAVARDDIKSLQDLHIKEAEFSADVIKLDRSLMNDSQFPEAEAIITECQKKSRPIIAEGIEVEAHEKWLLDHDVTVCQGYFYSPPIELDAFSRRYVNQLVCDNACGRENCLSLRAAENTLRH